MFSVRRHLHLRFSGIGSALFAFALLLVTQGLHAAEPMRVEISRDTWVSAYGGETNGNNGSDSRLKTKGIVELSLLDFDPAVLRGQTIKRAWLYLRPASSDKQLRLTVSSVTGDWAEGDGTRYATKPGAASFNWARQDQLPWAWAGSDITAVIAGMGNSVWGFADASTPDAQGFQRVAVSPAVLAARLAGLSYGLALIDDVGSEYKRDGDQFSYQQFPNRFLYSKNASANNRPYLLVETGLHDGLPPAPVTHLKTSFDNLPDGQCNISWTVPQDHGPAGTMGFILQIKSDADAKAEAAGNANADADADASSDDQLTLATRVPAWLVPLATSPGERLTATLTDLPVDFTTPVVLYIRSVDAAGNASAITRFNIPARQVPAVTLTLPQPPASFTDLAPLPVLSNAGEVCIIDALDKITPDTGELVPAQPAGYTQANHLWSAKDRQIRLFGARSEFVSFQFVVQGSAFPQAVILMDDDTIQPTISRFAYVPHAQSQLPDPVIPISAREPHPVQGQRYQAGLVELYVAPDTKPGLHHGTLLLSSGGQTLALNISVHVWNFKLPNHLSFIPQMNVYGLGGGESELDFYRLAQLHRTCLNRLPYNWQGNVQPGGAPTGNINHFNWDAWDKRFGPLLDGSAFAELPRGKIPVEHFYLPLNENWPASIASGFTQGYWADEALTPAYRAQFVEGSRAITRHFQANQWHETFFEFFLNGKIIFKKNRWSNASSPWIFDEPVATQDFWALRWYGKAFHEGVNLQRPRADDEQSGKKGQAGFPKMAYRVDVSRPQWQRDVFDGVLDINVVGGPLVKYQRIVNERQQANREMLIHYGSTGPISKTSTQPAAWCIDAWLRGGDGVLPWQTMGNNNSWDRQDTQAMFYPGKPAGLDHPVPSLRLKSYRMGQQTTEYLTMLSQSQNLPRWAMEHAVRKLAGLEESKVELKGEEAVAVDFTRATPQSLWRMHTAAGMMLDQLALPDKERWIELRTPVRHPEKLVERLVK